MDKVNSFAEENPITFGLIVTFLFILLVILSAILGMLWPGAETYGQPGNILGRLVSIALVLALLSHLGWLQPAGFKSPKSSGAWLISLLWVVHLSVASMYAMTGKITATTFNTAVPALIILFIFTSALMEEIVFRGLILHALVRVWGSTKYGLIQSVILSSLFFCGIHILDVLGGKPLPAVLLQSLGAFFLGILFGSLVLAGKSIYPTVILHAVLNLSAYIIIGNKGWEPAPMSWLILSLLMILPAGFNIYQLYRQE